MRPAMNSSREEHRPKAEFAKAVKKAREINSLSVTYLRAASLLSILAERAGRLTGRGRDLGAEYAFCSHSRVGVILGKPSQRSRTRRSTSYFNRPRLIHLKTS